MESQSVETQAAVEKGHGLRNEDEEERESTFDTEIVSTERLRTANKLGSEDGNQC
jgi:hypothetical protein